MITERKSLIPRCLIALFLAMGVKVNAQVVIDSVVVTGNKVTREHIILRELTFKAGDTLVDWESEKEISRRQLLNLFLFNQVRIDLDSGHVSVHVTERWYYWPIPVLDYADRNFNQWWLTRDLKRLIYGINFTAYNLRGRNETLEVDLIGGYTRSAGVSYKVPYLNARQTWGAQISASYAVNKEVWYRTSDDKVRFFRDNDLDLINHLKSELMLTNRPGFFSYHQPYVGVRVTRVQDTVLTNGVNSNFLVDSNSRQAETYLGYQYSLDKRNFKGYPTKGSLSRVGVELSEFNGFRVKTAGIRISYARYFKIKGRFYAATGLTARQYTFRSAPYTRIQALGYNKDYVRGYELKVIDGHGFVLGKAELRYKLFEHEYQFASGVAGYEKLPLSIYLTAYSDAAFVDQSGYKRSLSDHNVLPNTFLIGYGSGLNVVAWYDYVFRMEYSFDKSGSGRGYVSFVAAM